MACGKNVVEENTPDGYASQAVGLGWKMRIPEVLATVSCCPHASARVNIEPYRDGDRRLGGVQPSCSDADDMLLGPTVLCSSESSSGRSERLVQSPQHARQNPTALRTLRIGVDVIPLY